MKLIVKTLNGKQLPIEIEDSNTVAEIKAVIEKEHALKAETLKLIAYGKVLDGDDKKATLLLRAVDMFAYAEIWEGDDNWRETLYTVPELDGAGGSVDFLKLRPEDVERVKVQISARGKGV